MRTKRKEKSITIVEVAKEAKTSTASVSRYLNGQKIKEPVAIRVKEAIKKLNYTPNLGARFISATRVAKLIYVVTPSITTEKNAQILTNIFNIAAIYKYEIRLTIEEKNSKIIEKINEQINLFGSPPVIYVGNKNKNLTDFLKNKQFKASFEYNKEKDNYKIGALLARTAIKYVEGK